MRLFVAIDLPEDVKHYLRELQKRLWEFAGAKMSLTSDFHMTLKFLGECDEKLVPQIESALEQVKFQAFKVQLGEFGTFGGANTSVFWVSLAVPTWLFDTVNQMEDKMAQLGIPKENKFVPHVTLARAKSFNPTVEKMRELKSLSIKPLGFTVSQFHLFKSELSTHGAIHTKLRSFS
ncbi:MAG: RNA 2',3'-cyclic phosphodiesterase [Patescibacteria group bacterium]